MSDGGLIGNGLGEGRPHVVPYANSDFIVASLGEELGLIGLFALLLLYVLLFERGMKIASAARDGFGTLFAAGVTFTIALQCFIVIGGVTRLIPLTGLTTPFLAHGGSSLVGTWIIIGLLLRISDNARRPQEEFDTGVLPTLAVEDEAADTAAAHRAASHGASSHSAASDSAASDRAAPDTSPEGGRA